MRTHPQLMKLFLVLIIGGLLVAPLISAQEEEGEPAGEENTSAEVQATNVEETDAGVEAEEEEEGPQGIGLGFLLVGMFSVTVVGWYFITHPNSGISDAAV